ncbi:MAG TPA: hypothetical protein VH417_17255 [Vicinamibacterales bacterium]
MDDTNDGPQTEKKPYVKPDIQQVPLRPDEAVLGGCKTSSKSGSTQVKCSVPHTCSSLTS